LQSIARLGGISDEQFTACQNNKVMEEMILKRAMDASNQLEVESTPTLFVNGEKMTGALPYKAYQRSIEDALNRK
jgi:protein-disulfide isomerase